MNETTRLDRRELGLRAARWFSLALLGGGGTFLWWRNGTTETCQLALPCASCVEKDRCDLERAVPDPEQPKRSEP